ncbi:MAG: RecQ family ATP-dependent DNA helicase [Chlorobi bacterium]|nr:RecQ family ATP-dependent DNA helicase [Chlorobiota bacterium]
MNLYHQILMKYWGYSKFRPLQEDIIISIANGHDTLGLLPTGGGKSITFQVPALAKPGICLVITPLIALMKDQVENLNARDIKSVAIYSGMTKHEIDINLENCVYGNIKFLYLSPERLNTEIFKERAKKMKVNLIAIDESHCISQWGYDFRPSYLKIAELRELIPNVPFLALTATATPDVVNDIQDKLKFEKRNVFQKSFERKNLVYIVRNVEDKLKYLLKISVKTKGSGIVYVRNRKKTKEVALFLRENNITADYYHAGLSHEIRNKKQDYWKKNKIRIIVSTNAFGMGIDKPDVRFVVHLDLPDSIEAYFQEAGRAGRDEKKAYAVLLYHETDKRKLKQRIDRSFPDIQTIKNTYNALGNYFQIPVGGGKNNVFDFKISDFTSSYKLDIIKAFSSLKILQKEGYIEMTDELNNPSKLIFLMNREDLYKFQVSHKKLDAIIKLILRSYSGIFNDYVKIDENSLAKKANVNRDTIYQYLLNLSKNKVINYIPQKKTPLLIYTEERIDENALYISPENYLKRKERFTTRINAMLEYATESTKCRSQFLLNYFGEENPYRCGQCDICLKRNELDLSKYEFDSILEEIKLLLKKEPLTLDKLVDSISKKEEKTVKVIRWLLDNHKIIYNDINLLQWVKM